MEHRYSARVSQIEPALVYHNAVPAARCRIRNLSAGGAFIETRLLRFELNATVELEFKLGGRSYRLPAAVVSRRSDGLGIMFIASETDNAWWAMRSALYDVGQQTSIAPAVLSPAI
ncbi:MAG: PilZ domain-containing protein [Pseudomonadota bacterium]|nr:MAG: PilZ domain-containing protein [Pseudomonadota bacterium]